MKINTIDNLNYVVNVDKVNMAKKVSRDNHQQTDKADISKEAKKLSEAQSSLSAERLELIKERIASKFYDQDDVLQEIAERILKSKELKSFLNKLKKGK